jgi:hypothetical protein
VLIHYIQVLSGILPISRISAVPACTYAACQYLPLENILKLAHPREGTEEDDRRTWRDGMKRERPKDHVWTAMDILVAYADLKGWQTAKAGRPDIHRAGNASELEPSYSSAINGPSSSKSFGGR